MWSSDIFWLPLLLRGKKFKGKFLFDKPSDAEYSAKILDKEVYERAKSGELTGFSIEGDFVIEELMKESENEFLTQVINDLKSMLK
jgi:hypothetical protein